MWVIGGGIVVGVVRYVGNFFISGTVFSANVTSGNITTIIGTVVPFTGLLAGNNTIKYILPFAIIMAVLIGVFMTIKRKARSNV